MIDRIVAVAARELDEVRRSRLILTTLIVPTILYVVLPVVLLRGGALGAISGMSRAEIEALERSLAPVNGMSRSEAIQALLVDQVMVLYMLAPLFIPLTIASYSIIGEKQLRTLEPLLATPIRTWELLTAKAVAAALPGVLVSWVSYLAFVGIALVSVSPAVVRAMVGPTWLVAFGLVVPLFSLLAVGMAVIASSRTNDPRAAQQLGAVVILPISGLLFAQVSGLIRLDVGHILLLALGAALADVVLLRIAVRLFNRESILTHWR